MDPDNFQWVASNSSENDYVGSSPDLASAPLPAHTVRSRSDRFRPDPKRTRLRVCSQYMTSSCPLSEERCDKAHPPHYVMVVDGTVTCCFYFVDENHECRNSPCTFFHPPQHLKGEVSRRMRAVYTPGAAGSNQEEQDGDETEEDRRPYPDLSLPSTLYRRTGESPLGVDTTELPRIRALILRRVGHTPEGRTPGQSRLLIVMPPEYTDQPRPITWPQMGTLSIPPQQGSPGPSSVGMHPPLGPQIAQSHGLPHGPPVGRAMSNFMPPEYNQVHQFMQPQSRFTSATPDMTGSLPPVPVLPAHLESSTFPYASGVQTSFRTMLDSPFAAHQPRPPGLSWAASNPVYMNGSGLPTLQGPYPQYAAPGRLDPQPGPSMASNQPPLYQTSRALAQPYTVMHNQAPCPPLAPHGFHLPPQPPGAGVYAPSSALPHELPDHD